MLIGKRRTFSSLIRGLGSELVGIANDRLINKRTFTIDITKAKGTMPATVSRYTPAIFTLSPESAIWVLLWGVGEEARYNGEGSQRDTTTTTHRPCPWDGSVGELYHT